MDNIAFIGENMFSYHSTYIGVGVGVIDCSVMYVTLLRNTVIENTATADCTSGKTQRCNTKEKDTLFFGVKEEENKLPVVHSC